MNRIEFHIDRILKASPKTIDESREPSPGASLQTMQQSTTVSEIINTKASNKTDKYLWEDHPIDTKHDIYHNYDSLLNDADLIIIGEPKNDIVDDEAVVKYGDPALYKGKAPLRDPRITDFYTLREMDIVKVIKGDIEGKTMKVGEDAALVNLTSGKRLFISSDYSVMQKGFSYILFLDKGDITGNYFIMAVNQGKFNVDGKDLKEKEKEVAVRQFNELKKEVLSKCKVN